MAKLVVHVPDGKKIEHICEDSETTIGRASSNTLTITDGSVSEHHARVAKNGGTYVLDDVGSTNGSYVNGARIQSIPLEDGDIVMFGLVECTFMGDPVQHPTIPPKPPKPLPKLPKYPAPV
jgi:pSer/pThr/pTyr-binding forkhead associated (FHA) protein